MRKMNIVVGTVSLGIGILIGVVSLAVATDSTAPSKLLAKMHLGTNNVALTNQTGGNGDNFPQTNPASSSNITNPNADPSSGAADSLNSSAANLNGITSGAPQSPNGELPATTDTDKSAGGPGNQDASQSAPQGDSSTPSPSQSGAQNDASVQQIIADYKQDIGIFFDAWKSPDMTTFRATLAKAYGGDLLERHAQRAEQYILQGVGLETSKIDFDNVTVERYGSNTATLKADYRYTASDYILSEGTSVGLPSEHTVHVRANLVKTNQRWLITGETTLD